MSNTKDFYVETVFPYGADNKEERFRLVDARKKCEAAFIEFIREEGILRVHFLGCMDGYEKCNIAPRLIGQFLGAYSQYDLRVNNVSNPKVGRFLMRLGFKITGMQRGVTSDPTSIVDDGDGKFVYDGLIDFAPCSDKSERLHRLKCLPKFREKNIDDGEKVFCTQ